MTASLVVLMRNVNDYGQTILDSIIYLPQPGER